MESTLMHWQNGSYFADNIFKFIPRELWNPLSKTVLIKCSLVTKDLWISEMTIKPKSNLYVRPVNNFIIFDTADDSSVKLKNSLMMMCETVFKTRYVNGTPTSEVTTVTIQYIRPPHHGHTSQYHGHEWMTHILFVPCQSAIPFLR